MVSWDPWLEMRRLERDMGALRGAPNEFPQIRATSDEKGVHVRAVVPGFALEDLELALRGDVLTLRGKRKSEGGDELQFERSLQLPYAVEAEQIVAVAKNGVLEIQLPRAAADAPRAIRIQAG
jgi:HSP20 family protein